MLGIIAFIVGLIVGWNVLPQPLWVKRLYDRCLEKAKGFLPLLVLIVPLFVGCDTTLPFVTPDIGHAKERAMAEIAIASVTGEQSPTPVDPVAGDKCPDCNDPPGRCGVGKVGDGVQCDTCGRCNGDGRVDEADLTGQSVLEPVPDPATDTPAAQREVVLHITTEFWKGWPAKWNAETRPLFREQGWKTQVVLEDDGSIEAAYFDVFTSAGKSFKRFEPLTLEEAQRLEEQ